MNVRMSKAGLLWYNVFSNQLMYCSNGLGVGAEEMEGKSCVTIQYLQCIVFFIKMFLCVCFMLSPYHLQITTGTCNSCLDIPNVKLSLNNFWNKKLGGIHYHKQKAAICTVLWQTNSDDTVSLIYCFMY